MRLTTWFFLQCNGKKYVMHPLFLAVACVWIFSNSIFLKKALAQHELYPPVPASMALPLGNWSGLTATVEFATLAIPGRAVYRIPEGTKGWYQRGLMGEYDGVLDLRPWYGIRLEIQLEDEAQFDIRFTLKIPAQVRHNLPDSSATVLKVQGKGWHTLLVPLHSFDYNRGQAYFLKFIKEINLTGKYASGKGKVAVRNIKLVKGNSLHLEAVIRSKPAGADSTVTYTARVTNSSDAAQQVALSLRTHGWEGMTAVVNPDFMMLQPGETRPVTVSVTVPTLAPQGARETQTLVATTSNGEQQTLEFITLRRLNGPFLVHTQIGWDEVLQKANTYEWAKKELAEIVRRADEFEVPDVPPGGITGEGSKAIYKGYTEQRVWPVAVAYKLTGDKKYARKIALFLQRLSAPDAYPTTLHANSQGIPQEGGMFEVCARSYDLIKDAGVLSAADKALIEQAFRLYIYTVEEAMAGGGISNWSVFNLCPAAQCALVIQDMHHFNYLMDGPCGIKDHLRYGLMDDGWWYEVTLSYNIGCAENMTQLGLAARPFGINFLNEKINVALTKNVGLRPFEYEAYDGMAFGKFGPVKRNYVTVKDMWDAITVYPDYRGIMFGMGDGHEQKMGSGPFELAYFAFRDTAYATVLKQSDTRDLLYGVPVLPANTPRLFTQSAHSDNAGVAVLRSQTAGRPQRERLQAAMKYGTHGSYHGHFDRASLLSLMRYGRSFWNPETSWFGYGSYMYKWWVQTSMAHNMVVVDGKMQEPKETAPLLFHSGRMMQAMAIETKARWSHPPYFGGYEQLEGVKAGDVNYVPIPATHPKPADVTEHTEPILQRRLMIVTDDYVVLADYLQAEKSHTFDHLLHLRGAKPNASLQLIGQEAQFDANPLSSGQFITNVSRYQAVKGAKISSTLLADNSPTSKKGGFNGFQEPGPLHIDVYHAWPTKAEVRVGLYAEALPMSKKVRLMVKADDTLLASDSLGTWILGRKDLDVSIKGRKTLELSLLANRGANTQNTLFWANAKLVTSKGKEISLAQLHPRVSNTIPTSVAGKDYYNGPVKIAGTEYTDVLPAEPENTQQPGVITVDLAGLNAVRFKASMGGDYPFGDEDQNRKTVSYRITGKEARFLTILEPYETAGLVKAVTATSDQELTVELSDGRTQQIRIEKLDTASGAVTISIIERKGGKVIRQEAAQQP